MTFFKEPAVSVSDRSDLYSLFSSFSERGHIPPSVGFGPIQFKTADEFMKILREKTDADCRAFADLIMDWAEKRRKRLASQSS